MKKFTITLFFLLISLFGFSTTPTGDVDQYFCTASNPTIADIVVVGDNIVWYATNDSTSTPLLETQGLLDETTYYAFDSLDTNAGSLAVTVHLIYYPAPVGDTEQFFCENENVTLGDLIVFNTDDFDGIYWYSTETQENGTELPISTTLEDEVTYYAFQAVCGCGNNDCLGILPVTVNLIESIPAPTGENYQGFCMNDTPTLGSLVAENTDGYNSIYWYTNPYISGDSLDLSTSVWDGDVYYAFQTDTNESSCINYLAVNVDFMTCLGIDDNQIGSFNLSPNPVKDILNLDFKNTNDKVSVTIYNTYGSLVYKNDFFNKEHVAVDVSELNSGIYFISSKIDKATNTIKFIKE